ncbi:MAG TPA: hypothetical protein VEI98_12790 [Xanthobacteraceae bacterium]|nr:hypothetical protein [Xanthobacteraceae bacterium]
MTANSSATDGRATTGMRKRATVRIAPGFAGQLASLCASLSARLSVSFAASTALIFAAAACLAVSACSPGVDYPSAFPAVHDMPPPRTEAPLDAQQVQQATEDLISDRNRLNSEAQGTQSKASAGPAAKSANAAAAAKKTPADSSPTAATAQAAGAETK